ncbi:MAG: 3-dehydroquinate synthase [Planctomycetota bacterium]|nr:MAG: 3-dehydroquinate synthase [Planctomycetota bacterium]
MQSLPYTANPLDFAVSRSDDYSIHFGGEGGLAAWVEQCAQGGRVFILADQNAWEHHHVRVCKELEPLGATPAVIPFCGGESGKSWQQAGEILDRLASCGFRRRDLLLLFGGGVICDAGGLVASLFMRGVPYALIPTTVMAQVDASIGGKVAVNHASAKNLIGAFHHPRGVWIDPTYCATTCRPERANGFAEMVKVALLDGEAALQLMEQGLPHLLAGRMAHPAVRAAIREAVRIKLDLLRPDPFEEDLDRVLNLGHAVGHALETAEAYRNTRHGFAVAVGLSVAARLSTERGYWDKACEDRVVQLLHAAGLPTSADRVTASSVWQHLQIIRRIRGGVLREVLLEAPGKCRIVENIGLDELLQAYAPRRHQPVRELECGSA